jgi:ketosteroid isomerase-like protein
MSQPNVEAMRRVYEANSPDALIGLLADDCVWVSDPDMPGGGTYRGKEEVRGYLDQLLVFEGGTIDVHEIVDLGERVLGVATFRSAPRSGPAVEWVWCQLVTFDDGLITELRSFLDEGRAREAAGISAD